MGTCAEEVTARDTPEHRRRLGAEGPHFHITNLGKWGAPAGSTHFVTETEMEASVGTGCGLRKQRRKRQMLSEHCLF